MRRLPALAAAAVALGGCGSEDESGAPAACLGGQHVFLAALETAPQEAAIDGTPIAECLTGDQPPGQIATVGEAMVTAATELNGRALEEPLGRSTVQLGYLVGVVTERAAETGGIHTDLARRVESAALFIPKDRVLPGGFQQRYEEGLAAGRESASATG
jgi:hypothetical protein